MTLPSDITFACVITALICLFVGYKIGHWSAMNCINSIAAELYKQLDIDGKPFNKSNDFDDSDDDFYEDPDFWKKR